MDEGTSNVLVSEILVRPSNKALQSLPALLRHFRPQLGFASWGTGGVLKASAVEHLHEEEILGLLVNKNCYAYALNMQ